METERVKPKSYYCLISINRQFTGLVTGLPVTELVVSPKKEETHTPLSQRANEKKFTRNVDGS